MLSDDIYAISGRIENFMAREDLSLTGAGKILSNTFSLFLLELHKFADTLPEDKKTLLKEVLYSRESLPCYVIRLCTPKPEPSNPLYEEEIPECDE